MQCIVHLKFSLIQKLLHDTSKSCLVTCSRQTAFTYFSFFLIIIQMFFLILHRQLDSNLKQGLLALMFMLFLFNPIITIFCLSELVMPNDNYVKMLEM